MRTVVAAIGLIWSLGVSAGVTQWVPFEHNNGHISIPVTLNGEDSTAILDTGATGNGISQRFLNRHPDEYKLGQSVIVRGVYGECKVNLIDGIQIEMFGSAFLIDQ